MRGKEQGDGWNGGAREGRKKRELLKTKRDMHENGRRGGGARE